VKVIGSSLFLLENAFQIGYVVQSEKNTKLHHLITTSPYHRIICPDGGIGRHAGLKIL
jgi:hypothetical protein